MPWEPGLGMTTMVPSVFPGEGMVPLNYGGFHIEAMFASGAWVSSTVDLLRFLTGVDGRANPPDILSAALVADGNHARVDGFVSLGVLVSAAVPAGRRAC